MVMLNPNVRTISHLEMSIKFLLFLSYINQFCGEFRVNGSIVPRFIFIKLG